MNTDNAMEILEGRFDYSLITDEPTLHILKEIANIWKLLGDGKVDTIITKDDFQHFWKRAKESLIIGGTKRL